VTDPAAPEDPDRPRPPEEPAGLEVFDTPPAVPGTETTELAYAEQPPADARIAHPAVRAFAFFLDGVATFVIVVVIVVGGLSGGGMELFWAIPIVPIVAALLDTVLTARFGVTPAKAILGIRVVDAGSGAPIGFGRSSLRSLVIVAPIALGVAITCALALFWGTDLATERFHLLDLPVAVTTVAALVIAARSSDGVVARAFSSGPLVFVGAFSYSVYLLHAPILQLVWQYVLHPRRLVPEMTFTLLATFGLLVVLAISYVFFRLVEEPFMKKPKETAPSPAF